ncbi:MAG: Holliday junction resolvase RuvX [Eubacteriales bacterium]|nr:MAG: Holliday junction resolvase RuvX [Firmicutes bacterium HGW-Firmicutes-8]
MRILGLDVGSKTIGVALSDEMGWTAQGLEVIRRKGIENDLRRLAEIIDANMVQKVVAGLPKNMNGTLGPQAKAVQEFMALLAARFNIPVDTWDERLTTVAAEKVLIEANMSRAKRKKVIDKMAAVMILQGYLNAGGKE